MDLVFKEAKLYEVDKTNYPNDRFRMHRRYLDDNENEIPETFEHIDFHNRIDDYLFRVTPAEENRLDLIASYDSIYGNENLWWVIAEANNIDDPFIVPVGTVLKIPSKTQLASYGGVLA